MRNSEFWLSVETGDDRAGVKNRRIGPVRVALLFGSIAAAMALLVPPMVDPANRSVAQSPFATSIDHMQTGSISTSRASEGARYTLRRSVLQAPGEFCIYDSAGRTTGLC